MTYGTLIDDILLRVYGAQGGSDDAPLERAQIMYWLQVQRDELVKSILDDQIKNGKPIDTFYIEREVAQLLDEEVTADVPEEDERLYFTLEFQPMSLHNDQGVVKVTTFDGVILLKTRLELLEVINDLKYSRGTAASMVYYRENRKIIVQGMNFRNLQQTSFIAYYIPTAASQTVTEDTVIKINDEAIPLLQDTVEALALRELSTPADEINNGSDDR